MTSNSSTGDSIYDIRQKQVLMEDSKDDKEEIQIDENNNFIESEDGVHLLMQNEADNEVNDGYSDDTTREDCDHDHRLSPASEHTNESEWITPENIASVRQSMGGVYEEVAKDVEVACITTDYAMQVIRLYFINLVSVLFIFSFTF